MRAGVFNNDSNFTSTEYFSARRASNEFNSALFDKNLYWKSFHAQLGLEQPKIRLDTNPVIANPLILMPTADTLGNLNPKTINSIAYLRLQHESLTFSEKM
jgi:hypothetical protein